LIAPGRQGLDEVATDKASDPGDQDSHGISNRRWITLDWLAMPPRPRQMTLPVNITQKFSNTSSFEIRHRLALKPG
jgi:hypothetical protein